MIKKKYIKKISSNEMFQKGFDNESDLAYYLDFQFKNDPLTMVIHDITIEYNGRSAQIDHLVIRPALIYVIETKYFGGKIQFNIKDWNVIYPRKTLSIPSPILQNERHIEVLRDLLNNEKSLWSKNNKAYDLILKNVILVSNKTIFNNEAPKGVFKIDDFESARQEHVKENFASVSGFFKAVSRAIIDNFIKDKDIESFADNLLKFDKAKKSKKNNNNEGIRNMIQYFEEKDNTSNEKKINLKEVVSVLKSEEDIFEDLKKIRLRLKFKFNLKAPYYVFSDLTLKDMIIKKPKNDLELLKVIGVGESKLKLYGQEFTMYFNELLGK